MPPPPLRICIHHIQEITDPKLTGSHYLSGIIINSGCNKYTGNKRLFSFGKLALLSTCIPFLKYHNEQL